MLRISGAHALIFLIMVDLATLELTSMRRDGEWL
jgi:hypothetical protein